MEKFVNYQQMKIAGHPFTNCPLCQQPFSLGTTVCRAVMGAMEFPICKGCADTRGEHTLENSGETKTFIGEEE